MNFVYKLFTSIFVCLDPMVLIISIDSIIGLLLIDVERDIGISRNDATIFVDIFYLFYSVYKSN